MTVLLDQDFSSSPDDSIDVALGSADRVYVMWSAITTPGAFGIRLSTDGTNFSATSGDYLRSAFGTSVFETDTAADLFRLEPFSNAGGSGFVTLAGLQAGGQAFLEGMGTEVLGAIGAIQQRTKSTIVGPFSHIRIISPSGNLTAGRIIITD